MLSARKFLSNCVPYNSILALAILFSGQLRSQEPLLNHEQFVSFSETNDVEKNLDRKKADKGKKKSKESRSQRVRDDAPGFAPVHPEVLELLSSINRSLKSIESMMREEDERDRKRPEQAFQQMNRIPQSFRPEMFGPQRFGPQRFGPQLGQQNPSRSDSPRNVDPRDGGPRDSGRRDGGPTYDGLPTQSPR